MKETDRVLSEILQKALATAEKTGAFVVDQAPDLIKQLLIWKGVQNGMCVLFGVCFLWFSYWVYKKTSKEIESKGSRYYTDGWVDYFGTIMIIIFSLLAGFAFLLPGLFDLIQIIFAPKIYLIEYAASLIK